MLREREGGGRRRENEREIDGERKKSKPREIKDRPLRSDGGKGISRF